MTEIDATDTVVLGCSPDDEASHQAFRDKFDLNFPLLVDTDLVAMKAYDAYGEKKLYGKTSVGVIRKTYIIDKAGKIAKVWKRVTPDGHADKLLEALAKLG
jgi:thioredoxin-dependent peroxiredoxin